MKKKVFLAVGILAVLTACHSSQKKSEDQKVVETAVIEEPVVEQNHWGQYEGTFPAADCEGIKTTLVIHDDQTYTLKSLYVGVEEGDFETSGVYSLKGDSLIELITPSSGEKTYYRILDADRMMLSDSVGTINQGELANHYILKKK